MEEKYMVNDILSGLKAELTTYQNAISEAENVTLRQTLAQIRNNDEAFQYDLFKVAQVKGYYIPAEKAPQAEINKVKEQVSNG
ncbi:MAG: spore coat protein [Clostridia bacterium]